MASTYLTWGGREGWQQVHTSKVWCVFPVPASGILFALVLYCLSLLPFSPSLSSSSACSQPRCRQEVRPRHSALPATSCGVTEPDNTANCSIFFEEIQYSVWFRDLAVALTLPASPPVDPALMQRERERVAEQSSSWVETHQWRGSESWKPAALFFHSTSMYILPFGSTSGALCRL